jgi:capsular polysaccharide biosynthesis protein
LLVDVKSTLIQISLPYGDSPNWTIPNQIYYKTKKYIDLDCAVSIRYNWFNYWHFYNDVIGQLCLLEKLHFDKSIPIIVPKKALNLKYVQDFLDSDYAKEWNWIFQDWDTYIRLKRAYFCKCIPNVKEQFIFANEILTTPKEKRWLHKRIYIKRDKKRGRYISNSDEIETLLKLYDFEIIDAESMSLESQIQLFSDASLIIGPHGAGLTNIFFRYPANCTLLEIFPLNHAPAHYYWLAKELGYHYEAISGSALVNGGFVLDKKKLELLLNEAEVIRTI